MSEKTSSESFGSTNPVLPSKVNSENPIRSVGIVSILEKIKKQAQTGPVTIGDFILLFGQKSHQMLIFCLSIPFMQPIPLVGLSTPFGSLISLLSLLDLMNVKPWVPGRFSQKLISSEILVKSADFGMQLWGKINFLIKPRVSFFVHSVFFKWLSFFVVAANGVLLALPLPIPFSNTVPNFAILLNAIGQIEEDGFFILASYIACAFSFLFFSGLVTGIGMGLQYLIK